MTPPPAAGPEPDPCTTMLRDSPGARVAARLLDDCLEQLPGPATRIGVDVCDLAVLRRQLALPSSARFLANTFTEEELRYCQGRADRLGARWAAKEAVAKAIGTGFRELTPIQVEIRRDDGGMPWVCAATEQPWPYRAHTWAWSVSLSHDADLAIAAAIAVVPQPPPGPPTRGGSWQ
ncbi:holo-ACP synthase [Nocardia aurantia]|uniref:Holo-[acyl-carrier-protein] synthase n=1 Tax=Nocardia aurantia TaxID=2585199 RepID=A0A7K0DNQ4_9NOCA|nr:4'-phosphopantetheinyl transferase superfamily protein [Nocardia aurantia]MQY27238.1 hypothetical protein [Nocardia aurantia]